MVVGIVLLVLAALAALWVISVVGAVVWALAGWAVIGLLTGWVAAKLTGARLGMGWMLLAGVTGSWLGGAIFTGLLGIRVSGLLHLVASVLGATILITLARVVSRPALPGSSRPRLSRYY